MVGDLVQTRLAFPFPFPFALRLGAAGLASCLASRLVSAEVAADGAGTAVRAVTIVVSDARGSCYGDLPG